MPISEFIKKLSEFSNVHWNVIWGSCLKWTSFSPRFSKTLYTKLLLDCPTLQGKWKITDWIAFLEGTWRYSPASLHQLQILPSQPMVFWFSLPFCVVYKSNAYSISSCQPPCKQAIPLFCPHYHILHARPSHFSFLFNLSLLWDCVCKLPWFHAPWPWYVRRMCRSTERKALLNGLKSNSSWLNCACSF